MVKKPIPAPIPHKNGYRLHFCYRGKQYRRFYIKDEDRANYYQRKVNFRVEDLKMGVSLPPQGVTIPDFIFRNIMQEPGEEEQGPPRVAFLSELIEMYQRLSQPPRKSQGTFKTETFHLNHLKKFVEKYNYGDPLLTSIDVGFFDYYKEFRYSDGIRTDTVKKELGTFHCMFEMAVDHSFLETNVVKLVKRDKSQVPNHRFRTSEEIEELLRNGEYSQKEVQEIRRFRYLTENEIKELISLAEGRWLHPILITFAYTGIRRNEMIRLEWGNVDFKRRVLWVNSKKQSRMKQEVPRSIEMHETLIEILQKQKGVSGKSRWIFPDKSGKQLRTECLRQSFKRLVEGTKFDGLGFHVFRHSLASNLAAKGVDQRLIDNILGHQTPEMRKRYQHLFPPDKRSAINNLNSL